MARMNWDRVRREDGYRSAGSSHVIGRPLWRNDETVRPSRPREGAQLRGLLDEIARLRKTGPESALADARARLKALVG